ncbi:MAG: hypothetical protein N2545_01790 [Thermoflexales bacterium]|nr:hypothetical protein [Thermoflexales bacterium]
MLATPALCAVQARQLQPPPHPHPPEVLVGAREIVLARDVPLLMRLLKREGRRWVRRVPQ